MGVWDSSSRSSDDLVDQVVTQQSLGKDSCGIIKMESWIRGVLIGAGAFGKVNLALNRENGELFAVKSIECNERNTSEMQAMKNEVAILASLDSPHVVKCLGSSHSVENGKSMHNVFVEYMSGGSLADLMKKFGGHFEEPLIRNYTRSILQGIHYLHQNRIVHCDIKGKNVLVGSSGVKLADFGAAKRMSGGDDSITMMKGTPLWMAPEVVSLAEQGPASDIWSLGCTVLEMATGKAPWIHIANGAANPFVALYHIHRSEEVPELPACLSDQAHDFLRKCFQRDPRVRSTAEELLKHPFITESFPAAPAQQQQEQQMQEPPTSPTSTLDFPSSSSTTSSTSKSSTGDISSQIVNSVPILRSPLFAKRAEPAAAAASRCLNFQLEQQQQQQSPSSNGAAADRWCNSPLSPMPGQWIVVRSPKAAASKLEQQQEQQQTKQEVEKTERDNNVPLIPAEEVAVEPAATATDSCSFQQEEEEVGEEQEEVTCSSIDEFISQERKEQVDDGGDDFVQQQGFSDLLVLEEDCAATTSSSDDDEQGEGDFDVDVDMGTLSLPDNVRLARIIHANANACSSSGRGVGDGEDPWWSACRKENRLRRGRGRSTSSSRSSSDRASRSSMVIMIRDIVSALMRRTSVYTLKLASSLRKLATAHRKMTSRGDYHHLGMVIRFSVCKQVHELLFEKLSTLGRSLHTTSSFRHCFFKGRVASSSSSVVVVGEKETLFGGCFSVVVDSSSRHGGNAEVFLWRLLEGAVVLLVPHASVTQGKQ
ncbi:hypothetical protein R1sor_014306 [Riccia sorocarpa]|uniref:Protein kinase domain-containing protein n=1 Tax=Riccia sorocarpa TaxID=122646 RepID=A0ABD3HBK9_9MARC